MSAPTACQVPVSQFHPSHQIHSLVATNLSLKILKYLKHVLWHTKCEAKCWPLVAFETAIQTPRTYAQCLSLHSVFQNEQTNKQNLRNYGSSLKIFFSFNTCSNSLLIPFTYYDATLIELKKVRVEITPESLNNQFPHLNHPSKSEFILGIKRLLEFSYFWQSWLVSIAGLFTVFSVHSLYNLTYSSQHLYEMGIIILFSGGKGEVHRHSIHNLPWVPSMAVMKLSI